MDSEPLDHATWKPRSQSPSPKTQLELNTNISGAISVLITDTRGNLFHETRYVFDEER